MKWIWMILLVLTIYQTHYRTVNPHFRVDQFIGALTSFGVICKTIAHSIQSCLICVPAKFQGLKSNRTRVTSNFLRLFKTRNYFCGIAVCDIVVRHRRFEKTSSHGMNADVQDYAPARNVTDAVIVTSSKDCLSELAIFGRRTPLVAEAR